MATHLTTELILGALGLAVRQLHPAGVIHHSDQGSHHISVAFGNRCLEAGVRPSVGSVGDFYESGLRVSFFATLGCELIDPRPFRLQEEERWAMFDSIERWYKPHCRNSLLNYASPARYEIVQVYAT